MTAPTLALEHLNFEGLHGWFGLFGYQNHSDRTGAFAYPPHSAANKRAVLRATSDGNAHGALRAFWNLQ